MLCSFCRLCGFPMLLRKTKATVWLFATQIPGLLCSVWWMLRDLVVQCTHPRLLCVLMDAVSWHTAEYRVLQQFFTFVFDCRYIYITRIRTLPRGQSCLCTFAFSGALCRILVYALIHVRFILSYLFILLFVWKLYWCLRQSKSNCLCCVDRMREWLCVRVRHHRRVPDYCTVYMWSKHWLC